jgi:hypothetical protein
LESNEVNLRINWSKRLRHALGALSIALTCIAGSAGFSGCTVASEDEEGEGRGGSRGRDPEATGGDEANGARAGDASQAGAASPHSGGEAGGEGGASDPGEPPNGAGGDQTSGGRVGTGGTAAGDAGETGSGAAGSDGSGVANADPGTWTYLVYMLADNDLEPFALQDLEELMEVGSGQKLTILVQVDRAVGEADDAVGGLADFTSTKRVRVETGSLVELDDVGEANMGESRTLSDFISWGIETSPSEHYALVLWDHGSAWPQFGADFSHSYDGLTLSELTSGIDQGATEGELLGPLDLVGFDACLMATWEVAVALEGRARYLLASEEVEPGHGWDHRRIAPLRQGSDAEALGRALLDGYGDQANSAGTFARITLSLTDLAKVPLVSRALDGLTAALTDAGVDAYAVAVGKSRAESPTFGAIPGGTSSHMTDLGVWADRLAALDNGIASQARAVRTALSQAVVEQVSGSAHAALGGLSIFFPERESGYAKAYAGLAGVGAWRDFIEAFYEAADSAGVAPVFTNPGKLADVTELGDGLLVEGQLQSGTFESLTGALFDFGIVGGDGTAYFLGEQPADVSASGLVSARWDTAVLALSQGGISDFGYYSIEVASEDALTLSVPFNYVEGNDEVLAVLLIAFDSAGTVLSQGFYTATDGAWAELVAAPGSTLVSLVPVLEPNASQLEWVPQLSEFDATEGIDLELLPLDPGTDVFVQLQATDFAGQGDSVSALETL